VLRDRMESLPLYRFLSRRAVTGKQPHSHTDPMFALSVVQHQIEQVERRLDEMSARLEHLGAAQPPGPVGQRARSADGVLRRDAATPIPA